MPHQEAKLIVISSRISLDDIERILGESHTGGHTLGSARTNGLIRQQSMWLQKSSVNMELLEDLVDGILNWLSIRYDALKSLDQTVSCKISCKLQIQGEHIGFVVSPQIAKKLSELNLILLLDV